jgi:GDP-L-fucose synthase
MAYSSIKENDLIFIAGHKGLVGSAVVRQLKARGYGNLILRDHRDLDLTRQADVEEFFRTERPVYVVLAAGKVGGILANSIHSGDFIYENLAIALNVIHAAHKSGVRKLINLGSSCIYPKLAPQPLKEEYLLTGPLESTNEAYAVAKIAGVKLCIHLNRQYKTNFLSVMPTNIYGINDNYDASSSHVLPALIRKIHEAEEKHEGVTLWGDGSPYREFLYADDLADALILLLQKYDAADIGEIINIGAGKDITIKDLAHLIAGVIGYTGSFTWDTSKPNGTPRKLLDVSKITALGWKAKTGLKEGIELAYRDYLENRSSTDAYQ